MPKTLVIIGGGHTGSSAALAAARLRHEHKLENELNIILLNATPSLGVRPRYYEYELEQTQVKLTDFLQPLDVNVIVAQVTALDLEQKAITYTQQGQAHNLAFDGIVLAMGSQLIQPPISGITEHSHNIDTYAAAKRFRQALQDLLASTKPGQVRHIVILGGGLAGIELACELPVTIRKIAAEQQHPPTDIHISIVDRHQTDANLGAGPQPYIAEALQQAGVHCIDHADISAITADSVKYNNTEQLPADLVVSTLGLRANALTAEISVPKDKLGRIKVDAFLQIPGHKNCFAAGDTAVTKVDEEHDSVMSCQQGRPQGRYAGYNAVAALFGYEQQRYSQPNYVTCLDLGAAGAVFTEGWERQVKLSGAEAKKLKQYINCDRIYPPQATSREALLDAGKLETAAAAQTMKNQ